MTTAEANRPEVLAIPAMGSDQAAVRPPDLRTSGLPDPDHARVRHGLGLVHGGLLVLLLALRPLVWDGDAAAPANVLWLLLALVATVLVALEVAAGWRRELRWGWGGVLGLGLVALLFIAAWRAPVPATGWALWLQLAVVLGWSGALAQIIPGRERLVLAGLAAGLAGQLAICGLQPVWAFPAMTAAQATGDLALGADGINAADFAERVARGGVYGTFTLANTLAAYLLLVVPAVAALAWQRDVGRIQRGLGFALGLAALVIAGLASSKGAYVAGLAAAGMLWTAVLRGPWRWLPLAGALAAGLTLWLVPAVSETFAASARVRVGYWTGALRLISEAPWTGHGIGAFIERGPGVLPLWAEPSRLVHNEVLEVAVVAGLPAAALLVALLVWLAAGTARGAVTAEPAPRRRVLVVVIVVAMAYSTLLGMLDGNVGWWPGGQGVGGMLGYGVILGALMGVVAAWASTAPVPARRWWSVGIAALALHALIDFDLHSIALVALLAVVATTMGVARTWTLPPALRPAPLLAALSLAAVVVWGMAIGVTLRQAEDDLRLLRLARSASPTQSQDVFAVLAERVGAALPADERQRHALWFQVHATAFTAAGADPRLRLNLAAILPAGRERQPLTEELRMELPFNSLAAGLQADDLAVLGRWDEALAAANTAIDLGPASLAAHRAAISLLRRAAVALPTRASELDARRLKAEARLAELADVVDVRNR